MEYLKFGLQSTYYVRSRMPDDDAHNLPQSVRNYSNGPVRDTQQIMTSFECACPQQNKGCAIVGCLHRTASVWLYYVTCTRDDEGLQWWVVFTTWCAKLYVRAQGGWFSCERYRRGLRIPPSSPCRTYKHRDTYMRACARIASQQTFAHSCTEHILYIAVCSMCCAKRANVSTARMG